MDYTMMQAAGRQIEMNSREQLRRDWELDEANMAGMVELWTDTARLLRRAVAAIWTALQTGALRAART